MNEPAMGGTGLPTMSGGVPVPPIHRSVSGGTVDRQPPLADEL
ncbi:hypothetical protein [Azospirillum sp. Marseille-Q6669]